MKVRVSHRSLSFRLDTCFVLCLFFILLVSLKCDARIIQQESSDARVDEVPGDLNKSPLEDISQASEEAECSENTDAVNDKRHRRVSETIGKSDTENESVKARDVSDIRETDRKNQDDETVERRLKEDILEKSTHKGGAKNIKRLFKRPIRQLKRDVENVSNENIQLDEKMENKDDVEKGIESDIEGIRRLDVKVEEENRPEIVDLPEVESIVENKQKIEIKFLRDGLIHGAVAVEDKATDSLQHSAVILEIESSQKDSLQSLRDQSRQEEKSQILSNRADNLTNLQFWKAKALEFQQKVRDKTFLQSLRDQMTETLPGFPKYTESQFSEMLKTISSKKNIVESNDFNEEIFKGSQLNDQQKEILKCAQQLVAPKERQSFMENISECMSGWNAFNCMRIFIYPIIVDNMPDTLIQRLPQFPIEINVREVFQGNRNKPKLGKQIPFLALDATPLDPDMVITNVLTEGLLKNPSNENIPSFIAEKNGTLSKLLTCNRLKILQMTEQFLPQNARREYSDEMLSCVTRFEYFSCIKYFSWPEIRKYYSALPQFPLSDAYLSSLIQPEYPLISFPGFENLPGHLPEVIDSGSRLKPESIIMNILKRTLNDYLRISTPPPPIYWNLVIRTKMISHEQMATIHLAEQLLPVNLRSLYVTKTMQCISQFDYYNCMKYATWPSLRQFNRQLPDFPNFQQILDNFQIPQIPGISNIFDFFSQFQLPQFEIPQFQPPEISNFNFTIPDFSNFSIPDISNFSIPDISSIFPPGQQSTAKPIVSETLPPLSRGNLLHLESKIYIILKNLRDSMGATPLYLSLSTPTYTNRKVFLFPLMTEDQSKIFALAESIIPPMAREPLITNTFFCLNRKTEFTDCMKTIVWPSMKLHLKLLPDFPPEDKVLSDQRLKKDDPTSFMSETIDNSFAMREFEKIFMDGSEDAISYIIRNIQSSDSKTIDMPKLIKLLRSIQSKSPEFLNREFIGYPRKSEFASILTEEQENIFHSVESMLPEQIHLKFTNEMIDCAQKYKFSVCARNVIFPVLYTNFQRVFDAQSSPVPIMQNFSKTNTADQKKIPSAFSMKLGVEKQEKNTQDSRIDNRISPGYESNPEIVIFGMIRKIQTTVSSLPEYPKESIVYAPEFETTFTPRQAHLLAVAEEILPHHLRKGFLGEMFDCNHKGTFLNCTRDIMFPLMKKAYPEFPDFPDFRNDLDRSKMLGTVDGLKELTILSRSSDLRRTLPYIDVIIKCVPQDKTDGLKLLIEKLPDTLYYDLYVKMIQCTKYSDGVSCGRDLIYPTLKQYYDAPDFNIDDYYPVSTQSFLQPTIANERAPMSYEVVCENLGFVCSLTPMEPDMYNQQVYLSSSGDMKLSMIKNAFIPFGKLSDGSHIFKRIQDIWNPNITPSVGTDKVVAARHTSHVPTNIINLMERSMNSSIIRKRRHALVIKEYTNRILKRTTRNVEDTLTSHIELKERRNSILERFPPKYAFNNITEIEILQLLRHMVKHKKDRNSENSEIGVNEYFVDSLNDTEKALITADQYEILKLVQGLNSETTKASFMSRVIQCIRSLSFIRCIGIFVWPMIINNLPFGGSGGRDKRTMRDTQIQNIFGMSPFEFEAELLIRKRQIESNFVEWYKSLMADTFKANIGPMSVNGLGDGELKLSFSGYRDGRWSRFKDHKSMPSILTIITDVIEEVFDKKSERTNVRKESTKKEKKERSLYNSAEQEFDSEDYTKESSAGKKRYLKDHQVIDMLLDKLRSTVNHNEDRESRQFVMQDAYRVFQVLFGPNISEKISNELKSLNAEAHQHYREGSTDLKPNDDLEVVSLEKQNKNSANKMQIPFLEGRSMQESETDSLELDNKTKEKRVEEKLFRFKSYLLDYFNHYWNSNKKRMQTGLMLRLPRLNDKIISRKVTSTLTNVGRSKMGQVMPGAGLAVSFLVQLFLAHTKAIASVSGILSNMALGSAMLGLMRDMFFAQTPPPRVKYIYDTDKIEPGISWPTLAGADQGISAPLPDRMHTPPPHFHY